MRGEFSKEASSGIVGHYRLGGGQPEQCAARIKSLKHQTAYIYPMKVRALYYSLVSPITLLSRQNPLIPFRHHVHINTPLSYKFFKAVSLPNLPLSPPPTVTGFKAAQRINRWSRMSWLLLLQLRYVRYWLIKISISEPCTVRSMLRSTNGPRVFILHSSLLVQHTRTRILTTLSPLPIFAKQR